MAATHHLRNVPLNTNLHPGIFAALAGTVLWIVLAAWALFGADGYTALQLAVVAVFAIAFVVTPIVIWRLAGTNGKGVVNGPVRAWLDGELDTHTGPVHGTHAAVMVLLAPVTCAGGITGVSFVAWLAAAGAL